MDSTVERRRDHDLRAVIDQAVEFKKTFGQGIAVSFLVENHVPPPLLQRVLMEPANQ